jgi:hypothetical protein
VQRLNAKEKSVTCVLNLNRSVGIEVIFIAPKNTELKVVTKGQKSNKFGGMLAVLVPLNVLANEVTCGQLSNK